MAATPSGPPLVDREFADLLPTNPNMADTGARNRRRVTEIPKPGPPGTSLNLASNGPELIGRVLDAYGRPIPQASIQVRDLSRSVVVAEVASAMQGAFRIRNLIPGVQYELTAAASMGGRRLRGSTLAVAPDTSVIIQVESEGPSVSQLNRRLDRELAGSVETVGYGFASVSTPRMLDQGFADQSPQRPQPSRNWNPAAPTRRTYQVPDHPLQAAIASAQTAAPLQAAQTPPRRPASFVAADREPSPVLRNASASTSLIETQPPAVERTLAFSGTPLESMELLTLSGQSRPLGRLSGELILLDFFGSWCGPCRQCVPKLNAIHRDYASRGLQLIGVACEHGEVSEAIQSADVVRRQLAIEYAVLVSPMEQPSALRDHFNVSSYPTLVLLDHSGKVLFEGTGGSAATIAALRRAIEQALVR